MKQVTEENFPKNHELKLIQKSTDSVIEVNNVNYYVLEPTESISKGAKTYMNKLIINNIQNIDSGHYICLVANDMGYNYQSAYVKVDHPKSKFWPLVSKSKC